MKTPDAEIYDDGFLLVEHNNFYAEWRGDYLKLTRIEFIILSTLVKRSERFVSVTELWSAMWGDRKKYSSMSMRVTMCRLRKIIEPLGMKIETLLSVGYRFIPARKNH